jgi:hypothetical protein
MINRRLLLINVVLATVIVWGVFKLRDAWTSFQTTHKAELVRPDSPGVMIQPVAVKPAVVSTAADWNEAAARNPFSLDRNDQNIVVVAPAAAAQPPRLTPPILYGTMSLGGPPVAILGEAASSKRSLGLAVGEAFGAWKIVEIGSNAVIVEAGGQRESLMKGAVPRDREPVTTTTTATAPDRSVVTTISGQSTTAAAAPTGNSLNPYKTNLNPTLPAVPPQGTVRECYPWGCRDVIPAATQ